MTTENASYIQELFGLEETPVCGTDEEVLRHHRLDGASLAEAIAAQLGCDKPRC